MKKLFFTAFTVLAVNTFAQIPTGSLVAYWPFNANANDMSGNGNNGVVNGATLTTDRFGNCNNAYSFNGISNKIVIPNSSFVDMTNSTDFSVCYWMNTYTGAGFPATTLCKNQYGSNSGYQFFSTPAICGNGYLTYYVAPSQMACSNTSICGTGFQNTWIFVAGVYNSTANVVSMYVNGVLQTITGARSGNVSTTVDLYFGCQTNSTEFYKGALDDIRIYKRILNQSEITALYNEPNPLAPLASPVNTTPAGNLVICAGYSTTLSASAGTNTINWFASPSGTTILGTGTVFNTPTLSAGTYTYYAEANNTCTVSARTAIGFTVLAPVPPVNTTPASNQTICTGSSATLNANSGTNTISWFASPTGTTSLGSGTAFVTPTLSAGSYSFYAQSTSCGTTTRIPVPLIVVPSTSPVNVTPSSNLLVCVGNSAVLNATCQTGSILWYATPTSTFPIGSGTLYVTPTLAPGNYTYYAETSACSSGNRTAITFTVSECLGITETAKSSISVNIYPNPNDGNFVIESSENAAVSITNLIGEPVLQAAIRSGKNEIDLSKFPNTIYFVEIKNEHSSRTFKVVKN